MARLAFAAKDYYELAMMIKNSENFSIIKKRVKATPTTTYLQRIFSSYGDVAVLFYDEQYEEAGEALVKSVFPKKFKKHSNIEWDSGAAYNTYAGDVTSGVLAGMIHAMLGESNYDNLAKCVRPSHVIDETFGTFSSSQLSGATSLILTKKNEDILTAMV